MKVVDKRAWFAKQARGVVVDGVSAPWLVVVEDAGEIEPGDIVEVHKSNGDIVLVKLRTEVPYASKNSNRRFSFDSLDPDTGEVDRHSRDLRAQVAERQSGSDVAEDGRPKNWSRQADGSVRWPVMDSMWADRSDPTSLGLVVRDRINKYKIGWYPLLEKLSVDEFDSRYPDGVDRADCGKGVWMSSGEFMSDFVWVRGKAGPGSRRDARAAGYGSPGFPVDWCRTTITRRISR